MMTMTRLIAYLRLWRIKRHKKTGLKQVGSMDTELDDSIVDFDLRPYLGWMEEEVRKDI